MTREETFKVLIEALQTVADYPISGPKNMDAENMKMIAIRAIVNTDWCTLEEMFPDKAICRR